MVLFGASGHAKVVMDCLKEVGEEVTTFIDDDPSKVQFLNTKVVRSNQHSEVNQKVIIAIGDNKTRRKISTQFNFNFGSVVHPSALIAKSSVIGVGTVVFHGSIIQADTVVGKHCIINTKASIDHDCKIADFVHVAPGSVLCGSVHVGEGTMIGAGTVVIQGIRIGKNVTIGAGSVIIKDIPDNCTVLGNPGRIIKTSNE